MYVEGGGIQHIAALQAMQLSDPNRNWEIYSNWADSIRLSPVVTKQTVRESEISSFLNFKSMLDYQIIQRSISLVLAAASAVRAGEGGSVCWGEEALPSQGHRAVPY